ncbi:hypothetical protein MTR_8g073390, partial [Medicago truncatula]
MQVVLFQQRCTKALKSEAMLSASMSQADKAVMVDIAKSVNVLCLRDKGLREVLNETITTKMLSKLDSLYMNKSWPHRKIMKQQPCSFRIMES